LPATTVGNGSGLAVEESAELAKPTHHNHIIPLPISPNRWVAPSLDYRGRTDTTTCSPERAKRRFTGLLNKLTRKNFHVICDRMLAWIDECDETVQGQVLRLACTLLFDRAVDEPERMGLYATLCGTMRGMVGGIQRSSRGPAVPGCQLMRGYMIQCWTTAFQEKNLSWGGTIRGSILTPKPVGEEYYIAEKQKRRGIGLAGFTVELIKLKLFTLQGRAHKEPFFQELTRNLEGNPKEGDVVSLCILLQNVTTENDYWRPQENVWNSNDYRRACPATSSKLAGSYWGDNGISPRLRCRLLVSHFISLYPQRIYD